MNLIHRNMDRFSEWRKDVSAYWHTMRPLGRFGAVIGVTTLGILLPIFGAFIIPGVMCNLQRKKVKRLLPSSSERLKKITSAKTTALPPQKKSGSAEESKTAKKLPATPTAEVKKNLPELSDEEKLSTFIDEKMVKFLDPFLKGKKPDPHRQEVKEWLLPLVKKDLPDLTIPDEIILHKALCVFSSIGGRRGYGNSEQLTTNYCYFVEQLRDSVAVDFRTMNLTFEEIERLAQWGIGHTGPLLPSWRQDLKHVPAPFPLNLYKLVNTPELRHNKPPLEKYLVLRQSY